MSDQENYHDKFQQVVSSYGQMESVLGADAYKVMLENYKSDQYMMMARADRQKALSAAIRVGAFFGMMMAIPVIVVLWKWALSF